jgi:predicted CoA-substrate-specific enzyme activase
LFKFTKWQPEMKSEYTIIAPQMSPIHWRLLEQVFIDAGFNFRIIRSVTDQALQCGQKLVNNDMCYPAILTVGSMVDAAINFRDEQGRPSNKVAIVMTQTGGGCRASQYAWLIRRALASEGREDIPVIPLAFVPGSDEPWNVLGLKIRDLRRALHAVLLGDILMTALHKTRPYEKNPGDCNRLLEKLIKLIRHETFARMSQKRFKELVQQITYEFSQIELAQPLGSKAPVGVVGEILLKYHPDGNNDLVNQIEQEGCEAVVTPLIDFFLYCFSGPVFQHELLSRRWLSAMGAKIAIALVEKQKRLVNRLTGFHWSSIYELSEKVRGIISLANSMGEGWLLPAEMIELAEQNCLHIVIAQPFACLANHAIGAGTIVPIKKRFPAIYIESINYDPGASLANQLNRIKLLASDAKRHYGERFSSPEIGSCQRPKYKVGLDIGSTTIKVVTLDVESNIVFKHYERHGADIKATLRNILTKAKQQFGNASFTVSATGSGALSLGQILDIPFVQEVNASSLAVKRLLTHFDADAIIELGGEDAKVVVIRNGHTELTMNDICAGGTGAFIDQMATLLGTDADGLDELAKKATRTHPIASRCGVFAKSDIQVLINKGTSSENLAKSVLVAVVNQTISNLMKGRRQDCRNIVLLGGPLTFMSELGKSFADKLAPAEVYLPDDAQYYVALGAAFSSEQNQQTTSFAQLTQRLEQTMEFGISNIGRLPRLFGNPEDLVAFREVHKTKIEHAEHTLDEQVYVGIDAGSTTIKAIVINGRREILHSTYLPNDGKLDWHIARLKEELVGYSIAHTVAIGYGERRMIDSGLASSGEVETVAHLKAAKYLNPNVSFVIDIGGQDIKVFWVRNGVIYKIQLNEACSSGCGSFIKTYADGIGLTLDEFDQLACESSRPVDLGTRCTVFMNSLTKQAQKEGIDKADIAAGIAYSVVRNALYKVIQLTPGVSLGSHIVVQGGTFLNDSVLRAFEIETGAQVIRPEIAGLMGAYGAALLAQERASDPAYSQEVPVITESGPNLIEMKLQLLVHRKSKDFWPEGQVEPTGVIGIPLALNMYDDYPYWHALFSSLGFQVILSNISNENTYNRALDTIFSGTVCYPAKLAHGHILDLVEQGVKIIWAPLIKWARIERKQRNHFNCPVVMGYFDAVKHNISALETNEVEFYGEPIPYDKPEVLLQYFRKINFLSKFTNQELGRALAVAEQENSRFKSYIRVAGKAALEWIRQEGRHGIVLAGHPYHIDPEVNHGIPELIANLGLAVFTEDSIAHLASDQVGELRVSDQWTYHRRGYDAAWVVANTRELDLIQLVSFSCGIDAVTSDQIRDILEDSDKIYTMLKIDEMSSRRPALIRIRSLLFALRERGAL